MKKIFILMLVIAPLARNAQSTHLKTQCINPVIGDISYVEKFGELPDNFTEEQTRISTHLEYIEKKCE